jgi:hypothetical protein
MWYLNIYRNEMHADSFNLKVNVQYNIQTFTEKKI